MRAKRRKPDLKEITWEEETPNNGGEYRPERSLLDRYRQAQIEAYQQWARYHNELAMQPSRPTWRAGTWTNTRYLVRPIPQPTRITPPEPIPEQRRARRYGWYRDLENNYTRNRQRYGD